MRNRKIACSCSHKEPFHLFHTVEHESCGRAEILDEAVAPMRRLGQQLVAEHPEVGKLLGAYFSGIALYTSPLDERAPREVLMIHGVEVATNRQEAEVFEVLRDRVQHSMPFEALKQLHSNKPVPEHPVIQAFVDGYLPFD